MDNNNNILEELFGNNKISDNIFANPSLQNSEEYQYLNLIQNLAAPVPGMIFRFSNSDGSISQQDNCKSFFIEENCNYFIKSIFFFNYRWTRLIAQLF